MATIWNGGMDYGILAKVATLTYADTTQTDLFDLPADSYVIGVDVFVITALDGDTTTMDIGKTGTANYFLDDLDISATGHATGPTSLKKMAGGGISQGTRPMTITATIASGSTEGEVVVVVRYITATHTHLH